MTYAVYRHYPPPRLRAPDAVHLSQGGGDVPPPRANLAAAYLRESPSLQLPRPNIAHLLSAETGGGGDVITYSPFQQAAYVREEVRYTVRPPAFIHEPPLAQPFPPEVGRRFSRQVELREDSRVRQSSAWLAALDDNVVVVGGDAHQPPAVYERARWHYALRSVQVFTGVEAAPYVPPGRIPQPSRPVSAPRRIESQVAAILAVAEAEYLPPRRLPAFYVREQLTWPQVSSPLAAITSTEPVIELQRVSFKAGREQTVYLSASEIRVFKAH